MEKIIIENRSKLSIQSALGMVGSVIEMGRVSNNNTQYCYATTFDTSEGGAFVSALKNKNSDRFVVHHNDGLDYKLDG